jgi:protocatechuate 3,4-dioxygenase beta subunit
MNTLDTISRSTLSTGRRTFLSRLALGTALFAVPGAFAEELARTPRQTEGPFYPDKLPLDTDNDLLIINDAITPAVGEVTYLSGRILDSRGEPLHNALIEIWQVDHKGAYLQQECQPCKPGHELPGIWPFPHWLDRGVFLQNHQAGSLPRSNATHPLCRQTQGARQVYDPVLREG